MTKKPVAKKASPKKAPVAKGTVSAPAKRGARAPISGGSPLARREANTPVPAKTAESTSHDVVLVRGRTEDGAGLEVLRAKNNELSVGEVRPLKEGQPLAGEVVKLKPRGEASPVCDVETLYDPKNPSSDNTEALAPRKGNGRPALVASKAYRDNYDQIWKRRSTTKTLN